MALAQAASSCLGEEKDESSFLRVFITLEAKVELSVKAGDAGRGIPRSGLSLALDMKTLIARWAAAIRSINLFSILNAIVGAGHSV